MNQKRNGFRRARPKRRVPQKEQAITKPHDSIAGRAQAACREGSGRGVRVLSRIAERLRGLKGLDGEDACAVLVPCRDIHTFGMSGPIDAAFVDAAGSVVAVHRRVMPGRRIRHADARMVVERPYQTGKWLECGDGLFNIAPHR